MRVFNNQRYPAIFSIVVRLIQVHRSENIKQTDISVMYRCYYVNKIYGFRIALELCTYCATYAHAKMFIDE